METVGVSEQFPPLRLVLSEAKDEQSCAIAELAAEIWRRVYPGIIPEAQIEYMLTRMYSPAAMAVEMESAGGIYYLLSLGEVTVGFASLGPGANPGELMLHKLYLHPDWHGRGYGAAALADLESVALDRFPEARSMRLRVNKGNARAIRAYERAGFVKEEAVCSDIGGGFVMDDWWMTKAL